MLAGPSARNRPFGARVNRTGDSIARPSIGSVRWLIRNRLI